MMARIPKTGKVFDAPEAVSELKYHGESEIRKEIDQVQAPSGAS